MKILLLFCTICMLLACDDSDLQKAEDDTQGGTPAGSQGGLLAGTPAGSQGGAPAGSQGGSPAGSQGGTPAGSQGGLPAGTPAGSQGGMPAGTPSGSQGGTPMGTPVGAGVSDCNSACDVFATCSTVACPALSQETRASTYQTCLSTCNNPFASTLAEEFTKAIQGSVTCNQAVAANALIDQIASQYGLGSNFGARCLGPSSPGIEACRTITSAQCTKNSECNVLLDASSNQTAADLNLNCSQLSNSLILLCLPSLKTNDATKASTCASAYQVLSCGEVCSPDFRLFPEVCGDIVPLSEESTITCR